MLETEIKGENIVNVFSRLEMLAEKPEKKKHFNKLRGCPYMSSRP